VVQADASVDLAAAINYKDAGRVARCLESLRDQTSLPAELLVGDRDAVDESCGHVQLRFPRFG
jgi:hypothetical protein